MKHKSSGLIGSVADIFVVGRIIAVINVLVALGLIGLSMRFILFIPGFSTEQLVEVVTYIPALVYLLITVLLIASNIYCAFRLWKSNKDNVRKLLLVSLVPVFVTIWPFIFFVFFFSSIIPEAIPLFVSLVIALFFLILLWYPFKKLSIVLFLITLLVASYAFASTLEENYCWRISDQAEDKDVMYSDLTEAEKKFMGLSVSEMGPGEGVSGWLRVHLKCHDTFDFLIALKESLFQTPRFTIPTNTTIGDTNEIPEDKPRDTVIDYQVEENDTLELIADKFAVSVNTIKWANNISGNSIKPGQSLKIPPVTGIMHTVMEGETIYTVAKKYEADVKKIIDFPYNSFSDEKYTLITGQTIMVPDGIIQ